jgi:hypothetical protein
MRVNYVNKRIRAIFEAWTAKQLSIPSAGVISSPVPTLGRSVTVLSFNSSKPY